jgi:hypothetical protein
MAVRVNTRPINPLDLAEDTKKVLRFGPDWVGYDNFIAKLRKLAVEFPYIAVQIAEKVDRPELSRTLYGIGYRAAEERAAAAETSADAAAHLIVAEHLARLAGSRRSATVRGYAVFMVEAARRDRSMYPPDNDYFIYAFRPFLGQCTPLQLTELARVDAVIGQ